MIKKLLKNKLAFAGLLVIVFLSLIAFLGYLITPDKSQDANDIHLEIALQKPGFKVQMITLAKPGETNSSVMKYWLNGKVQRRDWIPVSQLDFPNSYTIFAKNGNGKRMPLPREFSELSYEDFTKSYTVSRSFWMGTDRYGRDVLSRIVIGARVSLLVGLVSVFITLIIGTVFGLLSGYFGGWVDRIAMWLINVVWSLPSLLIAISISFAFSEKGLYQVFLAIGLSMWVELARIVRGQVLQIKEMEYVQAAKVLGFSSFRIIFKHILPNISAPIIVVCAANFASAILLEAGLSFLGLGVQPPTPSWGSMIKEHYQYIVFDSAHLAIIPGLCIMFLVMSFNFLGNGLRDALDVNLK